LSGWAGDCPLSSCWRSWTTCKQQLAPAPAITHTHPFTMIIRARDRLSICSYAAGIYAMISVPTPGHCNETVKPGKPARNCTDDYENMLSNMTLVRGHPATWGCESRTATHHCASSVCTLCLETTDSTHLLAADYICDDCVSSFEYLDPAPVTTFFPYLYSVPGTRYSVPPLVHG
jgi:hypothetical protein